MDAIMAFYFKTLVDLLDFVVFPMVDSWLGYANIRVEQAPYRVLVTFNDQPSYCRMSGTYRIHFAQDELYSMRGRRDSDFFMLSTIVVSVVHWLVGDIQSQ
uniref:Uncharacterized protein n=1 Tax=Oryza glumipatula TaxID=40148 RepID=A0A0E0B7R0_9ORYZ